MIKASWHPATADVIGAIEIIHAVDDVLMMTMDDPVEDLKTTACIFGPRGPRRAKLWAIKVMQSFTDDFGV